MVAVAFAVSLSVLTRACPVGVAKAAIRFSGV